MLLSPTRLPPLHPSTHFRYQVQSQAVTSASYKLAVDKRSQPPPPRIRQFARMAHRPQDIYAFIKGYAEEYRRTARWGDSQGQVGKGPERRNSLPVGLGWVTPVVWMCLSTWKRSESRPFVFTEAPLHRHEPLNHWPLATDSNSGPSGLPRYRGLGLKGRHPLITWLVPWQLAPLFRSPKGFPKVTH